MAQPRKPTQSRPTARTRTRARQQRERERTPAFAVTMSIAAIFAVTVLSVIVMGNIHGTAIYNFIRAQTSDTPLSSGSVLYGQLIAQIEYQEVFITALSLLCGGVALGRLISPQFSTLRLLRIAAAVSAGVLVGCLLVRWIPVLVGQNWHLRADEVSTRLALTQTACTVGWIVAYLLGTWLGVLWRDHKHSGRTNTPMTTGIPAA